YGTARISITGIEDGDIFAGQIVLEDPVTCVQNEAGAKDDEFLNDEQAILDLQTPLLFKQHKNGVIVDVQIAESVDPVTANQLKSILNSLQATLSEDNDYPAVENGGQGSYIAHYTADLQHGGLQLTRTFDEGSFLSFNSQGDAPAIDLDTTVHSFLDRQLGVFRDVSFTERSDILGDPKQIDPNTIEGVALWGNAQSNGSLQLTAIEDTPPPALGMLAAANYKAADLNVAFDTLTKPTHGIDISTIDINAELDALEADPTNLALFQRIKWILEADAQAGSQAVVDTIAARLSRNIDAQAVALIYIDLLGHDGSPTAQTHLVGLIAPTSQARTAVSERTMAQVMVNLALLKKPTPSTVAVVRTMQSDPTGNPQAQPMANAVLGALVPALMECDPEMGAAIYNDLASRLRSATTTQEEYQLLLALGNTESPQLFDLVQPYIQSTNPKVQWAALFALRDVPGDDAEELL
ncbi:MAG: hypothetical protein KDE31_36715, partial [Caldilineaceae bacterium]|nr:hypothetical protein [Caldilineaceae bacterium]